MSTTPDRNEITNTLRLFVAPGDFSEIRVIGTDGGAPFGFYFTHEQIERASNQAAAYSVTAKGVYLVMNRIGDDLKSRPKLIDSNTLTKDVDIVRRHWLLIDFDPSSPERTPEDSATNAEKESARQRMEECSEWLRDRCWPEPVFADSGNGWHLLFKIDLPNDDESHRLIRGVLQALSKRFSDHHVAVDISVHNASRITKLYGTRARKGQDRPDRPHRLSKLLSMPDGGAAIVARELLEAAVADGSLFNQPKTSTEHSDGNLEGFTLAKPKLILPEVFPVGGRHETLVRAAGAVRSIGMNETEILETLRTLNRTRCDNGKPDDELVKIARDFAHRDCNLSMKALMECATEEQAVSAERQQKLRYALQHALKKLADGGDVSEVTGAISTVLGAITTDTKRSPFNLNLITSEQFATQNYRQHFSIRRILVEGQPCVLGGPKKVLKTSLLVDLVLSLGTGTPFLGHDEFNVPDPMNVLMLSGESGGYTLQETARRIALARGRMLSTARIIWGFTLPQLGNVTHLAELSNQIREHDIRVAIIDPAYLCLLSAGMNTNITSNVFAMGALLKGISEIARDTGCTPIIAHHTRKGDRANLFGVPDLEDLSGSGFAEWARQWILLNRREAYEAGTGEHRLWLNVGGSAGHSGTWALDISEGTLDEHGDGRTWAVWVMKATEAVQQSRVQKEQAQEHAKQETAERNAERLRAVLSKSSDPLTASKLRTKSGMNSATFEIAFALIQDEITEETVKGGNGRTCTGYRLANREAGQVGQRSGTSGTVPPARSGTGTNPFRGLSCPCPASPELASHSSPTGVVPLLFGNRDL